MYFKTLEKDSPRDESGHEIWHFEKRDPGTFTVEELLRGMMQADGYAEATEEEYLAWEEARAQAREGTDTQE